MLSRFIIVMIHIDKTVFHIKLKRYLPNDLCHLNYHVEKLYLKLILRVSFTVICNIYNMAMVSGFWLDLKLFVPRWMIKRSVLRFSGGLISAQIFTTTFTLLSDNSHPYIFLTIESPTIDITIWSFFRYYFFLLRLKFSFFLFEMLVLFGLLLLSE